MGGFLFNGCGASDSYKKIKDIRQGYCKSCRKLQMFGLYELDRKIRVAWIPTLTISTKCAVICEKCKNGIYVEREFLDAVLNENAICRFDAEGIDIALPEKTMEKPAVQTENQPSVQIENQPLPKIEKKEEEVHCNFCGKLVKNNVKYCPYCGKMPEHSSPQKITEFNFVRKKKVCSQCGLAYSYKKVNCDICGRPLKEE